MHLWSFDGADATARAADSVGGNNLVGATHGTDSVAISFGSGYDTSSSAVTTTRNATGGAGFLTSSVISLPTTVSYEAIIKPGAISAGRAGYVFAAISGGNRNYFTILTDSGKQLVTASGTSFNNQSSFDSSSTALTDWYYLAVTLSYDGTTSTTVNAWSANLSTGGPLVHTATIQVKPGSFLANSIYGIGGLSNGTAFSEAFPGQIDEIALYSGLKSQAFFEGHLALIPEPSSALLVLFGGGSLFLRRRR